MKSELLILFWSFIFCVLLMIRVVPKSKMKEAQIVFIFAQALAWIYEYVLVAMGYIEFPFREFPKASEMSFSLYYLIYPSIAVFFIFSYPPKGKKVKIIFHYLLFSFVAVGYSVVIEKFSELVKFKNGWKWYIVLLFVLFINIVIKLFYSWLFFASRKCRKMQRNLHRLAAVCFTLNFIQCFYR
ncbi:CBO0543 family protein [Margalitia sp. FSL K6-0131]|uniref:CBO0543 family protein n=1 Tax=Margalitia sp. FSL K6-0131 TaxID=2954604 RepID=UPI0030F52C6A